MGMEEVGEVAKEDDEFEVYRKRMMLAYRFRPNPLVGGQNTGRMTLPHDMHGNQCCQPLPPPTRGVQFCWVVMLP